MDEVTKAEIERLHDEERRQNKRLDSLEGTVKEIQNLTLSVQRLADSMERMVTEQTKQGERLTAIETKPAENWNSMTRTAFNLICGAVCGGVVSVIGYLFIFGIKTM